VFRLHSGLLSGTWVCYFSSSSFWEPSSVVFGYAALPPHVLSDCGIFIWGTFSLLAPSQLKWPSSNIAKLLLLPLQGVNFWMGGWPLLTKDTTGDDSIWREKNRPLFKLYAFLLVVPVSQSLSPVGNTVTHAQINYVSHILWTQNTSNPFNDSCTEFPSFSC
jgi:hypothetical protein